MFTGTGTALVTPFRRDGSLDEATLQALVKRQIDAGIDFLVPCGTTGESPTLTHEEHLRVVEITVKLAKGRVPVLAGAGGYNTAEVIAFTPVRRVGSGRGWNNAECNDGKGVPVSLLCFTFTGSTAPNVKSVAGIF